MAAVTLRAWRWDGDTVLPHREGIPLSDRGFRYGHHFFESLAVRHGRVLLAREHVALLRDACTRGGLRWPRRLAITLLGFLKSANLSDGMIRIYLTAGSGSPWDPAPEPACYLAWEATTFPSHDELRRGLRLVSLGTRIAGAGWSEKSGNYLPHLEALAAARKAGGEEAVMIDARGRVVSGAMANLLVWMPSPRGSADHGLRLCTPAEGARSGTVLGWVRRRSDVHPCTLTPADLRRAHALALTNSRLGVMPVASLDGLPVRNISPAAELSATYLRAHGLANGA